jgi:GNAT superfamily N-acetyltransferase
VSMVIRPPAAAEWPACRMLLPESFRVAPPDAYVAWDDSLGVLAGVAAFHRLKRETIGVQVRTVRTYRRQGIGSRLLQHVCARARERGDDRVRTWVDLLVHPEAEPFLKANGFRLESSVLQVEGELNVLAASTLRLRARLEASAKIPVGAHIVESRDLPRDALLRAYRELVPEALPGRPELAEFIVTAPLFDAAVLLVGERFAGMLVGTRNDGKGTAVLNAVVVAPEFRGGWSWANTMLTAYAFERSLAAGARRLRFEMEEANWNVVHGVERVQGTVVGRPAWFVALVG